MKADERVEECFDALVGCAHAAHREFSDLEIDPGGVQPVRLGGTKVYGRDRGAVAPAALVRRPDQGPEGVVLVAERLVRAAAVGLPDGPAARDAGT